MNQPISPLSPRPADGSSRAPAAAPQGPAAGSVAFQALLEDLESRAHALEAKSREELTPDGLAGAVDDARASLERMLSLQDRLLEAWRASRQAPAPPTV